MFLLQKAEAIIFLKHRGSLAALKYASEMTRLSPVTPLCLHESTEN